MAVKTALIVRHTPFEGIAGFRAPVEAAGYAVSRIDVANPDFGRADFLSPDLLCVMGGPMGVYQRSAYPWIDGEVTRLAERVAAGRPTLGVCLGAQLIAAALGARVYPGPVREVGFGPVTLTDAGHASPLRHLARVPVLHWHGDTFDLPEGVEHLAATRSCNNQAFRRGPALLALQCHPEMGEDPRVEEWLADADYVESAGTTVAAVRRDYAVLGPAAVTAGAAMMAEWLGELSREG